MKRKEVRDILKNYKHLLGLMPIHERTALELRENKTLEEVAQFFGVSRERIRQIETRAMHRLRAMHKKGSE